MRSFGLLLQLTFRLLLPNQPCCNRLSWRRILVFFFLMVIFLPLQAINRIALLADRLFFDFKNIEPRKPIFLVGVPRSGTTMLHRLLALDTKHVTTFRLWELLFAPAILQKYVFLGLGKVDHLVGRPFGRLLRWCANRLLGKFNVIHGTSLGEPEEDYLALLSDASCFLLILPFPFAEEIWQLAYFEEQVSQPRQRSILKFYRGIVQRHLYVFGVEKRFISKNPSFTPLVRPLAQEFPDAQFIGCLRSPMQVIPSLFSSLQSATRWVGNENNLEYQSRFLAMLKHFYHLMLAQYRDRPRYIEVDFGKLVSEPFACIQNICRGLKIDDLDLNLNLRTACADAANFSSSHNYSIEKFHLTAESIQHEFRFVFDAMNLTVDG